MTKQATILRVKSAIHRRRNKHSAGHNENKSYSKNVHMSANAVYEQLISEYGEQFTKEEAQYAIDHLND